MEYQLELEQLDEFDFDSYVDLSVVLMFFDMIIMTIMAVRYFRMILYVFQPLFFSMRCLEKAMHKKLRSTGDASHGVAGHRSAGGKVERI